VGHSTEGAVLNFHKHAVDVAAGRQGEGLAGDVIELRLRLQVTVEVVRQAAHRAQQAWRGGRRAAI
jgi:hypothetical protein